MRSIGPRRRARKRAGTALPEPTTPWSVRAPPCPRQRRARQPQCFLQRWARLPQVTRSKQPSQRSLQRSTRPRPITERGKEEVPGQAARTVEPQAAAITALVNETRPITGRGGESFQARRRGRSGRGGHGRGWSVQADHGRGRGGPGRSRPGESVRADHGGDEAPGPGPAGGTRCAVCRRAGPRIPAQRGEREEGTARALRAG